jgi:hypothetical protein
MGTPPPTILSYALHGLSTTAMLTYERQEQILSALTEPSTTQWNNGTTADAILLSAGGDDIVGNSFAIYLDYHGGGLDDDRFQGILASVQASYMDLFALRDIAAAELKIDPKQITIFGHCYDYAIPNNRPAGWPIPLSGPWLWPSLNFSGYDYNEGLTIQQAGASELSAAQRCLHPFARSGVRASIRLAGTRHSWGKVCKPAGDVRDAHVS